MTFLRMFIEQKVTGSGQESASDSSRSSLPVPYASRRIETGMMLMRLTRLCPLLLGLGLASAAWGQGGLGTPSVSRFIEVPYEAVRADPRVSKALDGITADDSRTFEEQKHIAQIPSPPFGERARAAYFLQRLREVGLADAALDQEGSVIAVRKGASGKPKLVVSAHLDTVFPEGTDVTVKERDGTTLAPGIGDDARGLAALLSLIQASTAATSRRSAM